MVTKAVTTAQAFLELPESSTPIELIEGEVLMSPSPTPTHQRLVLRVARLIEDLMPDGEVFIAPMDVLIDDANVLQPDVMWLAPESRCQVTETHLVGLPEFVVEVISPGTGLRDRREKFRLYERYAALEYWIVEPQERYIEVFQRDEDRLKRIGAFSAGDAFASRALGRDIPLTAALFAV